MITKISSVVSLLVLLVFRGPTFLCHAQQQRSVATRLFLKYNRLSASIPNSISDHTVSLVSNRFVYMAGGCNATDGNVYNSDFDTFQCHNITNNFYRYDLSEDISPDIAFATLPSMPIPRYRHVAFAMNDDEIWIVGGRDLNDNIIAQVDVFQIVKNRWVSLGNLSDDLLTSDQGSFSNGNYAYVAGGYYQNYTASDQVYRINTLTSFSTTSMTLDTELVAPLRQGRGDVAFVHDSDSAYIVGGFTDTNDFCAPLGTTERYSFADDTWELLSPLKNPRSDLVLAQINNTVFALGGERQLPNICNITGTAPEPAERTLAVDDVEVYNEAHQNWTVIANLPEHRFRFAAVVYNTNIYTLGGQSAYNRTCKCYQTSNEVVEYLDELENVTLTPMPSSSPSHLDELLNVTLTHMPSLPPSTKAPSLPPSSRTSAAGTAAFVEMCFVIATVASVWVML